MPPDECRSEGTPSLSEGPYVWGRPFGYFWGVCQKCLAVRAKPPAAVTAAMDMYTIQQKIGRLSGRHRWQASSHRDRVQPSVIGRLPDSHRASRAKFRGNKKPAEITLGGFLIPAAEESKLLQPPYLISRGFVRMTELQRSHHRHDQLIRDHKLNLPFLHLLDLPRLANKRLTAVQRTKLTQAKHLPRTVVIITDPPTTGSEHSAFDHLDMAGRYKKAKLVHRP